MTSGGKLNTTKLSVTKLRDICAGLDIAVDPSNVSSPMRTKLKSTVKHVAAKRISNAKSKQRGGVGG